MCMDYIHEPLWRRHLAEVEYHARLARLLRPETLTPEPTRLVARVLRFLRRRPRQARPLVPHPRSHS
jgi:hypothetical protein